MSCVLLVFVYGYTLRDIKHVQEAMEQLSNIDISQLNLSDREILENKLRSAQDNVAKEAEKYDRSFSDGPRAGKPTVLSAKTSEIAR